MHKLPRYLAGAVRSGEKVVLACPLTGLPFAKLLASTNEIIASFRFWTRISTSTQHHALFRQISELPSHRHILAMASEYLDTENISDEEEIDFSGEDPP